MRKSKSLPSSSSSCHHLFVSFIPSHPLHHTPTSPQPPLNTPKKLHRTNYHHILFLFLLLTVTLSSILLLAGGHFFISVPFLPPSPQYNQFMGPAMSSLSARALDQSVSALEREFWRRPADNLRPCLQFGVGYRRLSRRVVAEQRRFLVMEASGGINQQRNQIIDAVVIARILGAALVVPVLKVNPVWGDDSEFSEIFDVEHFIRTLRSDVHIVYKLPPSHGSIRGSPLGGQIPFGASPFWIRKKLLKPLNTDGVMVLRALDAKLSRALPLDLQRLRCKVAFHALRFAEPIHQLGQKLARRMWAGGPYVAIHLRLEKDVWVRTGCLPGIGPDHDTEVLLARELQPQLLTSRVTMSHRSRKFAGLCPLNAREVARLLTALGAPASTRLYLAGGDPFGGRKALEPLISTFLNVSTKETLAKAGELEPFLGRPSALAALDFMVALSSDVFLPSHGGNMGRALQGYRVYVGGGRTVLPNKRRVAALLEKNATAGAEEDAEAEAALIRHAHIDHGVGWRRKARAARGDVIADPAPECMCQASGLRALTRQSFPFF